MRARAGFACAAAFALGGWLLAQALFISIQRREDARFAARVDHLVSEHRQEASAAFMARLFSELGELGLIRCFAISESEPVAPPERGCGREGSAFGAGPVFQQLRGADAKVWNTRFELIHSPELVISLWGLRAMVAAAALALYAAARGASR